MLRKLRVSWPVLVILGLPVALLSPSLFGGHAVTASDVLLQYRPWSVDLGPVNTLPANWVLSDDPFQVSAWLLFTRHELAAGRFPFWDPLAAGGTPFFAADLPTLVYPLTWLEWVLPYPFCLTLVALLNWWIAGLGMYLFGRVSLKLRPQPALAASFSFMFSSFIVVWLTHSAGRPAVWLPWLLWASERAIRAPSPKRVVILALMMALVGVAGQPEMTFHLTLGASLYGLWLVCTLPAQPWLARLRRLLYWGSGMGLGVGLAAIQLLPTLAQLQSSFSAVARSETPVSAPVPLTGLLTWLVPNLWGNQALIVDYWGPANYNEAVFYAGAVSLVLAGVALLSLRKRGHRRERMFFGLLVLVFVPMLYGIPPFSWLTDLPVLRMEGWTRLNILPVFAVSALAGCGVEEMLSWRGKLLAREEATVTNLPRKGSIRRVLFVVTSLLILLLLVWLVTVFVHPAGLTTQRVQWLRFWLELALLLVGAAVLLLVLRRLGWLSHRAAATALVGLLLCEQLLFAAPYTPQPLASLAYQETPTLARLQQTIGSARMAAAGRLILPPNTTLPYQLHDLRAYEPTASSRYLQYMVALDPSLAVKETDCCQVLVCPSLTLLSVASVEYYATLPDEDANSCDKRQAAQTPAAGPFVPLWTQGGITLWRNTQARPRFYFASQVISSGGESQTLRSLASLSLTGREAIIEGASSVTTQQTIDQGSILVASDLPGEMSLQTQTETGRWLVINEGYDPGWQAEVDGHSTTIHPANEMFQAVYVPAGAHVIRLRYTPSGFSAGVWLSLLSLLALLSLLFVSAPVLERIRKRVRFHVSV